MDLTAAQTQAIAYTKGNLQLIACAGSGKTEVVARFVANLLNPSTKPDVVPGGVNSVYKDGWLEVRTALGAVPADSLIFGAVILIVEGDTEKVTLPSLLRKIASSRPDDFPDLESTLDVTAILSGDGDSVEYYARLALANGSGVVVLLDGDKPAGLIDSLARKHRGAPFRAVQLPSGTEFEDLVPLATYLDAVTQATGVTVDSEAIEALKRSGRATSKAVKTWLSENGHENVSKIDAMRRAVEMVQPDQLQHTDRLVSLYSSIVALLPDT